MTIVRTGLLGFLIMILSQGVSASVMPDVVVETTIKELLLELESRRAELEQDKRKLYQLVEDVVVPHIEMQTVARLILGKHWRKASEQQRETFAQEFKTLLIRTYATALFEYTGNEEMEIKPLRMKAGDKRTMVRTKVILPGAPAVPVDYAFLLTDQGDWKIYDVKIDGISLVTTYRSSYSQAVETKGLDALITKLMQKNSSMENS